MSFCGRLLVKCVAYSQFWCESLFYLWSDYMPHKSPKVSGCLWICCCLINALYSHPAEIVRSICLTRASWLHWGYLKLTHWSWADYLWWSTCSNTSFEDRRISVGCQTPCNTYVPSTAPLHCIVVLHIRGPPPTIMHWMLRNKLIYVFVFRILYRLLLNVTENELCCEFSKTWLTKSTWR